MSPKFLPQLASLLVLLGTLAGCADTPRQGGTQTEAAAPAGKDCVRRTGSNLCAQ